MLEFTSKISGIRVDNYGDIEPKFNTCISLQDVINLVNKQETMNYILDTLRFHKGVNNEWWTTMDMDTVMKLTILDEDKYSEIRKELENYFGEKWLKQYIRFSH